MVAMAVGGKHRHLFLSWLLVVVFLVITGFGSFAMMGLVSSTTHRSEGQIDLPYPQHEVWRALLDVEARSRLRSDWGNVQVLAQDRDGALQWEADTGFGKRSRFERTTTQAQSRIVVESVSYERNTKMITDSRIESLGAGRSRVVIVQERETPSWYDRSLLILYGINYSLQDALAYLRTYFEV